ncbi:MAG: Fic family protein [Ruminococcus sp.]|nr:Fic family protein [Candidatus Apopatosoma intestinale]
MDKEQVIDLILGEKYYSINDLRYNQKIGIMFSKDEFDRFLATKDQLIDEKYKYMKSVPLKTFNSKHCFYVNGLYLLQTQNEYRRILVSDLEINQSWLFARNSEDILISRLFSEVEGTLNIENVPTTHSHIAEINKRDDLTEQNDIIVKNMIDAIRFIVEQKPEFNKENLRKLYGILSKDCLPDELKIKDGAYYRDGKVYIGAFEGADWHIVDECMDSLFAFANDPQSIKDYDDLFPYICHYYILYVHPYFDYNGRTARMVSFWLNYIHKIAFAPYFMSEAINESKKDYYKAITDTRSTNNDLTYFLGYILETSIKYSFVYKNLEEIKKTLSKTGDTLTSSEWVYVKKILVHNPEDYFNHGMFLTYINAKMTRQGALKILNKLHNYEILEKAKNKKGDTIFKLNQDMITYQYHK